MKLSERIDLYDDVSCGGCMPVGATVVNHAPLAMRIGQKLSISGS